MAYGMAGDRRAFLSLLPARAGEKKVAYLVVAVSLVGFALVAPFAKTPLPRVDAFIPAYQAPLALNDLITAVLLFGQFSITQSRGLLLLASAYLFTALMVVAHLLSFPGAFAPTGMFGAGPQTTAWLYMVWHGGFPLLVICYALTSRANGEISLLDHPEIRFPRSAIVKSVAMVIACVVGAVVLTTVGHPLLPPIMVGNKMAPTLLAIVGAAWIASLAALVLVWRRKPLCVLDLWLMVALCAWLMDIALSAILNAARFDLGFYAGRLYGLCAASFVLISLLLETRALYTQLARSLHAERAAAERRTEEVQQANLALRDSESRLQHLNDTLEQRVLERSQQLEAETAAHARAQDALRDAQKLEAIGRMAGGIAHDFNNLLTIILGNAELLQSTLQNPTEHRAAKAIDRAAERGAQLVRQILAFSRRQPLKSEVIDLRARADDLSEMLGRTVRGDIQIVVTVAPDLWPTECDSAELELALMNLCVNARDAMPSGGLVRLEGRNVSLAGLEGSHSDMGAHIAISNPHLAGEFVALTLSDTGAGIAPDDLGHVFEPFFTTKEIGKGTGLGLSQVYGFAQQAGGCVAIESTVGKGTVVTLYLPRTTAQPVASDTRNFGSRPIGNGTILLIEDDEEVAKTAINMLATIGYQAHHVLNARTALALLLGGRIFDLLFSDIVMPGGMSGIELANKVRQHFPRQPILLATGYSRAAADIHRYGFDFIAKPYRADSLAKAIDNAIRHSERQRSQDTA